MKPQEFIQLLKDGDLSQAEFARITRYGVSQVNRWASGEVEVPHSVGLLLTLLAFVHQIRKAGKKCRKKK